MKADVKQILSKCTACKQAKYPTTATVPHTKKNIIVLLKAFHFYFKSSVGSLSFPRKRDYDNNIFEKSGRFAMF